MIKFIFKKFSHYQKAIKLIPLLEQLEAQAQEANISNIISQKELNQKNEKRIEAEKLKEKALNDIKNFFYQNGLGFRLLSTSTEKLAQCFRRSRYNYRFHTGILNQSQCVAGVQNELIDIINQYKLNGNYVIDNFNISKGFVYTFHFSTVADYHERTGAIHDFLSSPHPGLFAKNYSLLMLCAYFGMNQVIEKLIKTGCDIFYQASDNESALSLYQPTDINSQKEINYTTSLLSGTYNNGEYVSLYEKEKLSQSLNDSIIKNHKTLKV